MKHQHAWEKRREVANLIYSGISFKEIQERMGVSLSLIRRACQENGLPTNPIHTKSRERKQHILKEAQKGESCQQLQNKYGCSASHVRKTCNQGGVPLRHKNILNIIVDLFKTPILSFREIAERHHITYQRVQQIHAQYSDLGLPFPPHPRGGRKSKHPTLYYNI